jgi:hypothetical protein
MHKYKFIFIDQVDNEVFNKKPVYRIYNNRTKAHLGILSWHPPWKEYVFSSQPECIFNNSCMRDVLDFIENKITK